MAHYASKGWYVQKLKENGINRHPKDLKKLEIYKMSVVRNLYFELVPEENQE